MKILVVGATGQVGFEALRTLPPVGDVVAAALGGTLDGGAPCLDVDFTRAGSLASVLDDANADIIVNAAAYTAVDRAEDEPDLADLINHRAVAEIGAWATRHSAFVVHYSTDYVFDGAAKRPYREDDPTAPLGVYGRTKLAGEDALRASGAAHVILRTAWVYGARGHNFLLTMLRLGAAREELRIVADQIGAPTSAGSLAEATATIVGRWSAANADERVRLAGTYHAVSQGECSWFDFARAIFDGAAARGLIAHAPRLVPIATADYPTRARRPAYSVLGGTRLHDAFAIQFPDWRRSLESVLDALPR